MKKIFLLVSVCSLLSVSSFAQFTADLAGYPIVTTGWTIGGSATTVDSTIRLANSTTNQNGYIYYATPTNLTTCGQFTVDFDYKVTAAPGVTIADGIAFWYVTNPPVVVTGGGGCGIPNNANGLLMVMDTYDNNSTPWENPLITLLGYNGSTLSYTEGSATGQLGISYTQSYITDGTWHHARVDYSSGTVKVFVNYSTTPLITASYPMSINGYFGFSSSTGALYSTQEHQKCARGCHKRVSYTVCSISGKLLPGCNCHSANCYRYSTIHMVFDRYSNGNAITWCANT